MLGSPATFDTWKQRRGQGWQVALVPVQQARILYEGQVRKDTILLEKERRVATCRLWTIGAVDIVLTVDLRSPLSLASLPQ